MLSEQGLRQTLDQVPSFTTRKRLFLLYRWVLREHIKHGHSFVDVTSAVERDYIRDARPVHSLLKVEELSHTLSSAAFRVASGWKAHRLSALVALVADTGLRAEEVRLLPLAAVRLQQAGGSVEVKGRRGVPARDLTFSETTATALRDWLNCRPGPAAGLLFVANEAGAPLAASSIWRQIKRLESEVGSFSAPVSGISALRAAFAAALKERKVDSFEIQRALGHRQQASTSELLSRIQVMD